MKTLQSIDTKFRGGADENVTEKLNKENQQEFEIEEFLEGAAEKPEVVFEKDEETEKGFDVANYTRSIQIAKKRKRVSMLRIIRDLFRLLPKRKLG